MTDSEVLLAARDLIAEPGRWTQRAMARREDDAQTFPSDPLASSFCVIGAVTRVSIEHRDMALTYIGRAASVLMGPTCISSWNDSPATLQSDVVDVLDDVARLAKDDGR